MDHNGELLLLQDYAPAGAVVIIIGDNLPAGSTQPSEVGVVGREDELSEHVPGHGLRGIAIGVQWVPALYLPEHGPHLVHHQLDDLVLCAPTDGGSLQLAAGCTAVRVAVSASHA